MSTPIIPCLWFDNQAEEAVNFYLSIFPNSRINEILHYSEVGKEYHGKEPGTVLTIDFELDGKPYTALNGGSNFSFTPAVSFQIMCDDQEQIDHYWERLKEGGPVEAQQCGWLQDKYGLSWQVVPKVLPVLLTDKDRAAADRAMGAIFGMKKLDIATLQAAFDNA